MKAVARQFKKRVVDLYWTLRGPRICVPAIPVNLKSLLFVCKGNICRSPFAEHMARKMQREGVSSDIKFGSAGLYVPKPIASPENALRVGKQFGVDLENHRSQPVSLDLVRVFDMVVAMEVWQYEALQALFPLHREKLFLLPLLDVSGRGTERGFAAFNIPDPYGGSARDFELCFERISRCLESFQMAMRSQSSEHLRNVERGSVSVSIKVN